MTQFGLAELVSDYGEFGRPQALREALQLHPGHQRLFLSPDGRHLLVWLSSQRRLLSFLHLPAASSSPPQPGDYLEHSWPSQCAPLCGLLFLQSPGQAWCAALVWESGRAEVWSPPRGAADKSWSLLQRVELCHGPRARVASVCLIEGDELLWCEERPTSNLFNYCLCRRSLRVAGRRVALGAKTIVLHHCPLYTMVAASLSSAAARVFLIPRTGPHPILIYAPAEAAVTVATLAAGAVHSKALGEGEADYKKLSLECGAVLTRQANPEVRYSAADPGGQLLAITADGWISLLHQDGSVRRVYDFKSNLDADAQVRMAVSGDVLVCTVDAALYVIDVRSGRLVAKQVLDAEVFLIKVSENKDVQLLMKGGVYKMSQGGGGGAGGTPDMVYEEACKYYQRRSLSNAKLTVQSLKEDGMFQAPITLSAILNSYHKNANPKEAKYYSELLSNINNELQSFLSLERLKARILNAPDSEVTKYCDELVDLEITRLLQMDLDRDSLVYINSLFRAFPKSAWIAIRNNFQFQQNGDGKLVVRATADLWKKVLSPLPSASREGAQNGVQPLFEVICQSLCTHKPKWLPGFVQHAQECSGLYWNYTTKEHCEGAPLYKRALFILRKRKDNTNIDLEVELLLCSGRPQAVIQAIHALILLQRWSRVMEETQRYSQLNPLIKKDVFITLLVEFVKHRQLDSYVAQLCDLCPDDLTATDVLRIVLQNMPKTLADPPPFSSTRGDHLTIGILRPLLNKVLEKQIKREENFPSPTFPPVMPERTNKPKSRLPMVNGEDLSPPDFYATKAL